MQQHVAKVKAAKAMTAGEQLGMNLEYGHVLIGADEII